MAKGAEGDVESPLECTAGLIGGAALSRYKEGNVEARRTTQMARSEEHTYSGVETEFRADVALRRLLAAPSSRPRTAGFGDGRPSAVNHNVAQGPSLQRHASLG